MLFSQRILLRRLLFACITLTLVMTYTLSALPTHADAAAVLDNCPAYTQSGNVSHIVLNVNNRRYSLSNDVMGTISKWQGQSVWQGYNSSNPLGVSSKDHRMATLTFTLAQNNVNGKVYKNDRVQIWFWNDDAKDYLIMFPFVSIYHLFTDKAGKHLGSHLCGDFAILRTDFDGLVPQNK